MTPQRSGDGADPTAELAARQQEKLLASGYEAQLRVLDECSQLPPAHSRCTIRSVRSIPGQPFS
jgi:hypothetical protein